MNQEFDINWHEFTEEGLPEENGRYLVKHKNSLNDCEHIDIYNYNYTGFYVYEDDFEPYTHEFKDGELIAWAKINES